MIYFITFTIILTTYFLLKKQKKQTIDENTNVLITGGCMGIGR